MSNPVLSKIFSKKRALFFSFDIFQLFIFIFIFKLRKETTCAILKTEGEEWNLFSQNWADPSNVVEGKEHLIFSKIFLLKHYWSNNLLCFLPSIQCTRAFSFSNKKMALTHITVLDLNILCMCVCMGVCVCVCECKHWNFMNPYILKIIGLHT